MEITATLSHKSFVPTFSKDLLHFSCRFGDKTTVADSFGLWALWLGEMGQL